MTENIAVKFKENIKKLVESGKLKEAKSLLEEYKKIAKEDVEAYSIIGVIAMMEGDMDEANANFKKGLALDETNFDLNYNLAYLYESTEKVEESIHYYKKALQNAVEEKDREEVYNNLKGLGVKESKEEILQHATVQNDKNLHSEMKEEYSVKDEMEVYKEQFKENIQSLIEQGLLQEAKNMVEEYEKIVKDDVDIYSIKGVMAMMEGDMDGAEEVLKEGLSINPVNIDILFNMAYLCENKGKYITAYRYYRNILKVSRDEHFLQGINDKLKKLGKIESIKEYVSRKKVLMVAYAFPPIGGPGVQRTLKFAKYLRNFGWEPIVVTVGETAWTMKDESLVREVPQEIDIIRINDIKPEEINSSFINKLIEMYSEVINDATLFNRYIETLNSSNENINKYLFIPEYQSAWALKVIENIGQHIDMIEIDTIYTSADPNADNFIGYFLKKKYSKPWIADFRDAWTNNPYAGHDKESIKYEIEFAMEKQVVQFADQVITTTPWVSRDYINIFKLDKSKVVTITNGYDEDDFKNLNDNQVIGDKFTMMHNGLFYQIRTPETFLKALRNLANKKIISEKNFCVFFTRKDGWEDVVKSMGLSNIVKFTGYLNHIQSLEKAITCNSLLLVLGSGEENKSIYPGKIFEYLRLNKPILALAPKNSLVDNMISELDRGYTADYSSVDSIESTIIKMFRNWKQGNIPYKADEKIKVYERKKLTGKLAEIFDNLQSERGTVTRINDNYESQEVKVKNNNTLKEKDSHFYDELFESGGWNKTYFKHYTEIHYYEIWLKALNLIKKLRNPKIIEIGCGPGQFAHLLFDNGIVNYRGIDFSKSAIKYAKNRNDRYKGLFTVDNAYTTDIFDKDYNTVIIFEVLEHVDEDLRILSRIKEGSNILFSVPNFYSDGHVRWFNSKQEIVDRYKEYIDFDDILSFSVGGTNKIFLVKGKSKNKDSNYIQKSVHTKKNYMEASKLKVNVVGLGYIGLPTALMFAAHDIKVVGTDYNKELINILQANKSTFDEKGLDNLFETAASKGIEFSSEYVDADIYIVAVPTPYDKSSKKIDASYIIDAINNITEVCSKGAIIVIESTISPGTVDKFVRPTIEAKTLVIGQDINIAHAPERIIPGNMIHELKYNSRTIGVDDRLIGDKIKELYSSFCRGEIVVTDIPTAEMTKVVENTFRDINIAFANELTKICRSGNMDVYEIIKIANMHPRVNILQPGPGVGGHCISVDPWFLVGDYPGLANIILAARKINDSMPKFVLGRIHEIMKETEMQDIKRVGLYGLTYKENVDDIRESPTLQLFETMQKYLAEPLKSYDPYVKKDIVQNQYHDFDKFLNSIDLLVIMVSHDEIKENMDKLKNKIVLDTKNICSFKGVYKL